MVTPRLLPLHCIFSGPRIITSSSPLFISSAPFDFRLFFNMRFFIMRSSFGTSLRNRACLKYGENLEGPKKVLFRGLDSAEAQFLRPRAFFRFQAGPACNE